MTIHMQPVQPQMQPVDAMLKLTVTLAAIEWQAVLRGLGKLPWEEVNPVVQAVAEQLQAAARQAQTGDAAQ